jgi:hypothetical protein
MVEKSASVLVSPVYLVRLPSMITNDQSSRGAAITSAEKIGKVFVAIKQNLRLCLICERVFTRQGAAEHAHVACSLVNEKTITQRAK